VLIYFFSVGTRQKFDPELVLGQRKLLSGVIGHWGFVIQGSLIHVGYFLLLEGNFLGGGNFFNDNTFKIDFKFCLFLAL
jgi:hypothetical protein